MSGQPRTSKVVACFDKFRLTASAPELCRAFAEVAWEHYWDCTQLPMADGGEGTIDALRAHGGSLYHAEVRGPLGDPVRASWLLRGRTAFIEMAQASGLALVGGPEGNRPLDATTYGTGELVSAALANGAKRIVVTVGGSATTDGGLGALEAMAPLARLKGVELVVACDVETCFVDAARDFGPQKGASAAQVALLTRRLEQLADRYERERGIEVRSLPGSGSAGGLAGALASVGATITSGFGLVADEARLADAFAETDLIVTGEGRLDQESFHGKVVGGVCNLAAAAAKPVIIVCGAMEAALEIPADLRSTLAEIVVLGERFGTERSWAEPVACVRELAAEVLRSRSIPGN